WEKPQTFGGFFFFVGGCFGGEKDPETSPGDFCCEAEKLGAASRPFRDIKPLPQKLGQSGFNISNQDYPQ
ncbi:hypothetical protein, partial [Pseudomonas alloputida]|uniref:hypothetical protein n=1 Tax=Pseudomonas alloputida TaxID=1940621 RepID=UPI003EE89C4D